MKTGSVIVTALMLISLAMDWYNAYDIYFYGNEDYVKDFMIIFNKMFMTTLVSMASLFFTSLLLKNDNEDSIWFVPISAYRIVLVGLSLVVFFIGGLLEVHYQAYHYFVDNASQDMTSIAFVSLFILGTLIYASMQKRREVLYTSIFASVVFILYFLISISQVYANSIYDIISGREDLVVVLLIIRWVSIIAVYITSILLFRISKRIDSNLSFDFPKIAVVFMVFTFIYLLSADLDTIAVLLTNSKAVLVHTQKTGYAIIWGLSSFILMIVGMKRKNKTIRILSLVLFAITLIKLFVYDIAEISKGGKIVAFIILGILLLVISFMYQKVKLFISEDEPKDSIEESKEEQTIE
jgi:uncharacterized membrane protein